MARVDERLHFNEERTRPFLRDENGAPRNVRLVFGKENGRGVRHPHETVVGHREDAEFVHRSETVLEGADEAEVRVGVPFEVEHRVDDVFENARPRERPVLRDVAHEKERDPEALGGAGEPRRALAHLRDRSRRAVEVAREKRLNRVEDDEFGLHAVQNRFDLLELHFAHELQPLGFELQALGAQSDLRGTFFAAHVEGLSSHTHDATHHLQKKRRLADPRIAPDEGDAARDEPAPHDAVEFGKARHDAGRILDRHVAQILQRPRRFDEALRGALVAVAARRALRHLEFLKRVPRLAVRTLTAPLEGRSAAFGTDEIRSCLFERHGSVSLHDHGNAARERADEFVADRTAPLCDIINRDIRSPKFHFAT